MMHALAAAHVDLEPELRDRKLAIVGTDRSCGALDPLHQCVVRDALGIVVESDVDA